MSYLRIATGWSAPSQASPSYSTDASTTSRCQICIWIPSAQSACTPPCHRDDGSTVRKPPGGGWTTSLVNHWISKDIFIYGRGRRFEKLVGAACVGVVGLNFKANQEHREAEGGDGGEESAPSGSRHASSWMLLPVRCISRAAARC